MSKIAELANHILDIVAEELDVPKDLILSKSRKAEVVDARHMAAMLLHRCNVYPSRIAFIFGVSPRTVQYAITLFNARIQTNRTLRNSYAKLAKQLRQTCETATPNLRNASEKTAKQLRSNSLNESGFQSIFAVQSDVALQLKYTIIFMGENSTKIFSFPESNGGGGANGLLAILPALMQQRGLDPNILALANSRNGGNSGGGYGNRYGNREDEEWDDEDDFGERRGRSSRTGRYMRR